MIIGLAGAAGCGKDTVADVLVAEHGFRRIAFADPLRAMVLTLDPFIPDGRANWDVSRLSDLVDEFGWDTAKRNFPEVRRLLQVFGTEVIRGFVGTNFWVDYALKQMAEEPGDWVVTDCRFPNEADAIINFCNQGWVVQIVRPGLEPLPGAHASEAGVPEELVDFRLNNDGTLVDLAGDIEIMLSWMRKDS